MESMVGAGGTGRRGLWSGDLTDGSAGEEGGPLPASSHRGRLGSSGGSWAPSLSCPFPAVGAVSVSEAKCPASTGHMVGVHEDCCLRWAF